MGLDAQHALYFVENYGKQTEKILKKLNESSDNIRLALIIEELRYCVEKEMTCSSVDFFMRRTGRLYFDIESVLKYREEVIDELALLLNWDNKDKIKDAAQLDAAIKDARNFLSNA